MWARVVEDEGVLVVAEVVDFDPSTRFTPDIASLFTPAEPGAVYMARKVDAAWVVPAAPEPMEPVEPPAPPRILQVSPPTFLLLFTPQERISIRSARQGENAMVKAVLDDWFSIIDDPRLQYIDLALQATQDGLAFLVSVGLLTAERKAEILQGFQ